MIALQTHMVKYVFEKIVIPLAKEYVARTDNTWDDKLIVFLEELLKFILVKIDKD